MIHVHMHSNTHDGALIVSSQFVFSLSQPGQTGALLNLMVLEMEKVNTWANDSDVLIGHLKAYVKWQEDSVMLTTTGMDVQVKGAAALPAEPGELDVGVTAIIYGPSLEEVKKKIQNLAGNILDGFGLEHEYSYECHNSQCTDPSHHHSHDHDGHDHCNHDHDGHEHVHSS